MVWRGSLLFCFPFLHMYYVHIPPDPCLNRHFFYIQDNYVNEGKEFMRMKYLYHIHQALVGRIRWFHRIWVALAKPDWEIMVKHLKILLFMEKSKDAQDRGGGLLFYIQPSSPVQRFTNHSRTSQLITLIIVFILRSSVLHSHHPGPRRAGGQARGARGSFHNG